MKAWTALSILPYGGARLRARSPLFLGAVLLGSLVAACSDSATSGPDSVAQTAPGAASAAPIAGRQQLSGHRTRAVAEATLAGRLDPAEPLSLTIGLAPKDEAALHAAVDAVSDPASPTYRQYLTPEAFADRFGASKEEYRKVVDWAKANNLAVTEHANRLTLGVTGAVADIESALHVHMHYGLREDGSRFHAPDVEPSLDLAIPVAHISNLESVLRPRKAAASGFNGSRRGTDLRNAYTSCSGLRGAGQSVGILMFDDYSLSDLNTYFASMALPPPRPVQNIPAGGGTTANLEGNLDVQMVASMAPDAQVIAFRGGNATEVLANMAARPDVKSLSSSWFSVIDQNAINLYAQLALQGQTFFQASGDSGALLPGYFNAPTDERLQPSVTLVGGTTLNMNDNGGSYGTESTWTGSSGGILSYRDGGGVAIPSYQIGLATAANGASSTYRNMPDVGAEASGVEIRVNGGIFVASGTSAAAPIWAGFMALVNQRAASLGVPAVGAANPALYDLARRAYATSFNDITVGNAPGSGITYSATPGYDLVTGLGSPKCTLVDGLARAKRTSDIVWRNTRTGDVELWRMRDGKAAAYAGLAAADATWVIQGTGDFNGDGTGDVLWRNMTTGKVSIWEIKDGAISAYKDPGSATLDWTIQGTGDFNGDGTSDILWRNTSGQVEIWQMNNSAASAYIGVGAADSGWSIQGTGDFNGDGTTDILWRHASGPVSIWQINNGTITAHKDPGSANSDWVIKGTGDFNGDGTTDILWRQTSTGAVSIWQIANGAIAAYKDPGAANSDWVIQGTGDFNDDGISDILWRQTSTGNVSIWQIASSAIQAYLDPGSAISEWVIRGTLTD